jgi:hypothetical protein
MQQQVRFCTSSDGVRLAYDFRERSAPGQGAALVHPPRARLEQPDVRAEAARVKCPTLVLHARGDLSIPFEEGRLIASLIPGARFVSLETRNHLMLETEHAWRAFLAGLGEFYPPAGAARAGSFPELTPRERVDLGGAVTRQSLADGARVQMRASGDVDPDVRARWPSGAALRARLTGFVPRQQPLGAQRKKIACAREQDDGGACREVGRIG